MGFGANCIRFSAMQSFENRLIFDKVTESLKVGTFLRHSVYMLASGFRLQTSSSAMAERPRELDQRFQVGSI